MPDSSEFNEKKREIHKLYSALLNKTRLKWKRDLPFEELLFDRWERAKHLGFADGANIYHNSYVYGDVTVGKETWIGPFTLIDGTGGLEIGNYCCISAVSIVGKSDCSRTLPHHRWLPPAEPNTCYRRLWLH